MSFYGKRYFHSSTLIANINMYLLPHVIKRFPRFDALLEDIKPWVNANSAIKTPFLACIENNEYSLNQALTYFGMAGINIKPQINVEVIPIEASLTVGSVSWLFKRGVYGGYDEKRGRVINDQIIRIEEADIIRLERTGNKTLAYQTAYQIAFNLLHEMAHHLRDVNRVGEFAQRVVNETLHKLPKAKQVALMYEEEIAVYTFNQQAFGNKVASADGVVYEELDKIAVQHISVYFQNFKDCFEQTKNSKQIFDPNDFLGKKHPGYYKDWSVLH